MKAWLKPDAPDEVSLRAGEYDKTFQRADEPFEVDEAEYRMIEPTGFFTRERPSPPKVATKKPAKAPVAPPEGPSKGKEE